MTQTIESKNKFEVPNRHTNGGGEWAVIYTIDQTGIKGRRGEMINTGESLSLSPQT